MRVEKNALTALFKLQALEVMTIKTKEKSLSILLVYYHAKSGTDKKSKRGAHVHSVLSLQHTGLAITASKYVSDCFAWQRAKSCLFKGFERRELSGRCQNVCDNASLPSQLQ